MARESSETGRGEEPPAEGDPLPAAEVPSPSLWEDSGKSEDQLLFGWGRGASRQPPGQSAPRGTVTTERLRELAAAPPSLATSFTLTARLQLPEEQWLDLGTLHLQPGTRRKLERVKEFPYPVSIQIAGIPGPHAGSQFPVTPTTPQKFEVKNNGVEVEMDVEPVGGMLAVGGTFRHTVFNGFGQMPGEAFDPITATDTNTQQQVVLTDNQVLQPQFSISESPFMAAVAAGVPCLIPVRMAFGPTFLEVVCTPEE